MSRHFRKPTIQFCIEVTCPPSGLVVHRFTIDQEETHPGKRHSKQRVISQVQRHLADLSRRNSLSYRIVRWGKPSDHSAWIQGGSFDD